MMGDMRRGIGVGHDENALPGAAVGRGCAHALERVEGLRLVGFGQRDHAQFGAAIQIDNLIEDLPCLRMQHRWNAVACQHDATATPQRFVLASQQRAQQMRRRKNPRGLEGAQGIVEAEKIGLGQQVDLRTGQQRWHKSRAQAVQMMQGNGDQHPVIGGEFQPAPHQGAGFDKIAMAMPDHFRYAKRP